MDGWKTIRLPFKMAYFQGRSCCQFFRECNKDLFWNLFPSKTWGKKWFSTIPCFGPGCGGSTADRYVSARTDMLGNLIGSFSSTTFFGILEPKHPGSLGFFGRYNLIQFCGDGFIHHEIRIYKDPNETTISYWLSAAKRGGLVVWGPRIRVPWSNNFLKKPQSNNHFWGSQESKPPTAPKH